MNARVPLPSTESPLAAAAIAPDGVVLSHVGLRDLTAIARLQRRAFPPRLAYTLPTLLLLHLLPWVRLLAARRGSTIVGSIIGDRTLEGGRVINLAVDPDARRQGIGRALLLAIEREFPNGDMTLMVQIENSGARALYLSTGYQEDAVLPHYYGINRSGIRMRKRRGTMGDGVIGS